MHTCGFALQLPSGPTWQDAQRATWSIKGSAGLKPCLFCLNVLNKGHPDAHDKCKFLQHTDEQYFAAAEELTAIDVASPRKTRETVLGATHADGIALSDPGARTRLPPSSACNDVLRTYFAGGVASMEISLLMSLAALGGLKPVDLRDMAAADDWHCPGSGLANCRGLLRRILDPRMFDADMYKVYLCKYYVARVPAR